MGTRATHRDDEEVVVNYAEARSIVGRLCAAAGMSMASIEVTNYRGPGERSDRKGWKTVSIRWSSYHGDGVHVHAPTEDEARGGAVVAFRAKLASDIRQGRVAAHLAQSVISAKGRVEEARTNLTRRLDELERIGKLQDRIKAQGEDLALAVEAVNMETSA